MCISEVISLWNISFKSSVNHGKLCTCSLVLPLQNRHGSYRFYNIWAFKWKQFSKLTIECLLRWHMLCQSSEYPPYPWNKSKEFPNPITDPLLIQPAQNSSANEFNKTNKNLTTLLGQLRVDSSLGSCKIFLDVWFLFCLINFMGSLSITTEEE